MITKSRAELIELLSYKGFTSDELSQKDDETLENLYIEYILCMNNNSVLVNKLIKMGVTDPVLAMKITDQYKKTGILSKDTV